MKTKEPQELRSEIQILEDQKENLEQQAQNIRATLEQDVQQKMMNVRKENSLLSEQRRKLESDKAEVTGLIEVFKKEKEAFEKMRQDFLNKRDASDKSKAKVTAFIRMVREAAETL
jgi:hypothetical protein